MLACCSDILGFKSLVGVYNGTFSDGFVWRYVLYGWKDCCFELTWLRVCVGVYLMRINVACNIIFYSYVVFTWYYLRCMVVCVLSFMLLRIRIYGSFSCGVRFAVGLYLYICSW